MSMRAILNGLLNSCNILIIFNKLIAPIIVDKINIDILSLVNLIIVTIKISNIFLLVLGTSIILFSFYCSV